MQSESGSGGTLGGCLPAKEEKVVAAERTAIRPENPMKGPFQNVPGADASKFDGSAVGTTGKEHT